MYIYFEDEDGFGAKRGLYDDILYDVVGVKLGTTDDFDDQVTFVVRHRDS